MEVPNEIRTATFVSVIILSACGGGASHVIDSEELSQEFAGKTYTNLLIIGVYPDRTFRVSGETSLAEEFKSRGIVYMLGGEPGAGTDLGSMIAWAGSGTYTLHVGLWDAETQKPVWQVTTNSESTGSESGDLRTLADFVVATLREKSLL